MSIKEKFDRALEKAVSGFLIFCVAIGLGLTVTGYVFSQKPMVCQSSPIIELHNWLLGFAVASSVTLVYAIWFIIKLNVIQIDIGFVVHIVAGIILGGFFLIYHWFAYDGLFGSHGCVRDATWGVTLAIIVCQLAAIPGTMVFAFIYRTLDKFSEEI